MPATQLPEKPQPANSAVRNQVLLADGIQVRVSLQQTLGPRPHHQGIDARVRKARPHSCMSGVANRVSPLPANEITSIFIYNRAILFSKAVVNFPGTKGMSTIFPPPASTTRRSSASRVSSV